MWKKSTNSLPDASRFNKEFFTVYDSKTGIYREPMIAFNQHDILRQIDNMMRDPAQSKNPLVLNSEDYSIFKVGEYDDKSGVIRPLEPIVHVANLHDIRSTVLRSTAQTPPQEAQAYS